MQGWVPDVPGCAAAPAHPCGARSVPLGPPWQGPPLSSRRGRHLTSFPVKLVKTAKCHRKVSKRPILVPICQNGVQKSPLDFLGYSFSLAFSHKELMGSFGRVSEVYVKMTKCRQCVHVREGVVRYPHVTTLWSRSSSDSARAELAHYLTFSTRSISIRN